MEHADLSALAPGHLNDMLVDDEGRAWVGNFGFDLFGGEPARSTVLISRRADGTPRHCRPDLAFPNGTVLTPDGRTLDYRRNAGESPDCLQCLEWLVERAPHLGCIRRSSRQQRMWARFLSRRMLRPTAFVWMRRELSGSPTFSTGALSELPKAADRQ